MKRATVPAGLWADALKANCRKFLTIAALPQQVDAAMNAALDKFG
jgi:hypothetical protein